ncbi:hypothetical protein JQM66_11725 [Oscillibacter valericigenes]|uniref:hypothetical protein n=1 Tax=Oscillibacter valericigenes TaxID=351091 RepID=UPI001F2F1254|nr:hypothetical protein [Oscillibacter valericigenes]MCF2665214.1 hypothetical protein [Oscillibacter valericigenes]
MKKQLPVLMKTGSCSIYALILLSARLALSGRHLYRAARPPFCAAEFPLKHGISFNQDFVVFFSDPQHLISVKQPVTILKSNCFSSFQTAQNAGIFNFRTAAQRLCSRKSQDARTSFLCK